MGFLARCQANTLVDGVPHRSEASFEAEAALPTQEDTAKVGACLVSLDVLLVAPNNNKGAAAAFASAMMPPDGVVCVCVCEPVHLFKMASQPTRHWVHALSNLSPLTHLVSATTKQKANLCLTQSEVL